MAVHTHITEGINLPRSASPNVSITAPPGTTPALLVAASRQLIREKSEIGREGKPGERWDGAPRLEAFRNVETQKYMLQTFQYYLSASLIWNIR